jgi:hypothetical protein
MKSALGWPRGRLRTVGQISNEPGEEDYVTASYVHGGIAEIEVVSARESELVAVPFRVLLPVPGREQQD